MLTDAINKLKGKFAQPHNIKTAVAMPVMIILMILNVCVTVAGFKKKDKHYSAMKFALGKKLMAFLVLLIFAAQNGAAGVILNTTLIAGLFSDLGLIFPSITDFIVNILPALFTLTIVMFVVRFLDKILGWVERVFSF